MSRPPEKPQAASFTDYSPRKKSLKISMSRDIKGIQGANYTNVQHDAWPVMHLHDSAPFLRRLNVSSFAVVCKLVLTLKRGLLQLTVLEVQS